MARPKAFDRDQALERAIPVFAEHGFEGTSTDALLAAMGIGRQSLYDTFGDKHALYVAALQHYNARNTAELVALLNSSASPMAGIAAMLESFATRPAADRSQGCLGVSAICEFGRSDREVALIGDAAVGVLGSAIERRLAEAQALGEADPALDPKAAVRFVLAAAVGIKVAARGGAPIEHLREIARLSLRSLS